MAKKGNKNLQNPFSQIPRLTYQSHAETNSKYRKNMSGDFG